MINKMDEGQSQRQGDHDEPTATEELLVRARERIGAQLRVHQPFNTEVTSDAVRHFAHGTGDDNPLYCDPEYARRTRWEGVIAPPMFYRSTGLPEKTDWTEHERAMARDPLSGVHSWYSGDTIYWLLPIQPGDRLYVRTFWKDFFLRKSRFAGQAITEVQRSEYRNQHGDLAVVSELEQIRGGRQKDWGNRTKYAKYERPAYTPEQIALIDDAYAGEKRRGAEPLLWEDVGQGQVLPQIVKGPITVTDVIQWNMGWGLVMQFPGTHRLAYQWRKKHPKAFMLNNHGVPESIEAVHWDDGIARTTGNPSAYDYGGQRIAWMTQLISDWLGDEGWLFSLKGRIQRFVYIGDTVWVRGQVTQKRVEAGAYLVDIRVHVDDQRGEVTAQADATAILPSKVGGPVVLPPRLLAP